MTLFRKGKPHLYVALDVGSTAIKGIIYELPAKDGVPNVLKRLAVSLPSSAAAPRVVQEMHALLGGVIKEFGRIPSRVVAGFGAGMSESRVETWDVETAIKTHPSQKDIMGYFDHLCVQHGGGNQIMIVALAGIEINGYALPPGMILQDARRSLFALGGGARDIRFRALVSYFSSEIAALLADMKRMLGGVPIEFIPLALAYHGALVNGLRAQDALVIDIGGASTMVMLLKGGELVQTAAFPFGAAHVMQEGKKGGSALWGQCLVRALDGLYALGPLPGEMYLCGGGAYLPEVRTYIEQGKWLKDVSAAGASRVTVLEGKSFFVANQFKEYMQGPENAGLGSVVWHEMHGTALV